jgi:hypothetical protein
MLGYLRCAACGVWRPPIHSSVRGIGRTGSSIVTRNGPCECPPLDARAHAGDGDSANREAMAIYHEINDRNKGGDT